MFKKSIKSRILEAVTKKIDSLQKEHDLKIVELEKEYEASVIKVADDMVSSFLSKFDL